MITCVRYHCRGSYLGSYEYGTSTPRSFFKILRRLRGYARTSRWPIYQRRARRRCNPHKRCAACSPIFLIHEPHTMITIRATLALLFGLFLGAAVADDPCTNHIPLVSLAHSEGKVAE